MPHFDADQWSVLLITVIFGVARLIVAAFAVRPLMSQLGRERTRRVAVECPFYPEVTDIGGRRRARQRQATGRARRGDPGRTPGWASLHPAISLERDDFSSNRHPALSFCLSMISAQTLRVCREGKPVPTFSGSCFSAVSSVRRPRILVSDALPQRPDHILHDKRVLPAVR